MYINIIITDINNICTYYSLFILFKANIMLIRIYLNFVFVIKVIIIVKNNLNYYRCINVGFYFCKSYYAIIVEKKISELVFVNCINVLLYQKYPDILNDLSIIKILIIIYAYLIMSI